MLILVVTGFAFWQSDQTVAAVVTFVIAVAALAGAVYLVRKEVRRMMSEPDDRR